MPTGSLISCLKIFARGLGFSLVLFSGSCLSFLFDWDVRFLPDVILGDLDSLRDDVRKYYEVQVLLLSALPMKIHAHYSIFFLSFKGSVCDQGEWPGQH